MDGVGDNGDLCPATPAGVAVDAFGCADAQVDGDGDGICDPGASSQGPSMCIGSDNCPDDANADQADFDSDDSGDACDADIDGGGVTNDADLCALTVADAPDRLGQNRWTLSNVASGTFDQAEPQAGTVFQFTTSNTGGCSCDEIVEITGAGKGHEKNGCSTSLMLEWIQTVP